jgi:hypothetical protein
MSFLTRWWSNLFPSTEGPGGWLKRNGHELKWPHERLTVTVYVHSSADHWWVDIKRSMEWLNALVGSPVLDREPLEPIASVVDSFGDGGRTWEGVPGAIYITCGDVSPTHAWTEVRSDDRTGVIRNAFMRLPFDPPPWAEEMVRHELCHAFGLAHGGGLMAAQLGANTPPLLPCDVARLREAYAR